MAYHPPDLFPSPISSTLSFYYPHLIFHLQHNIQSMNVTGKVKNKTRQGRPASSWWSSGRKCRGWWRIDRVFSGPRACIFATLFSSFLMLFWCFRFTSCWSNQGSNGALVYYDPKIFFCLVPVSWPPLFSSLSNLHIFHHFRSHLQIHQDLWAMQC